MPYTKFVLGPNAKILSKIKSYFHLGLNREIKYCSWSTYLRQKLSTFLIYNSICYVKITPNTTVVSTTVWDFDITLYLRTETK